MYRIALKILIGARARYLGLIFGIAFSTLLISHQISVFIGIMARTGSQISDIREADIWVMDKQVNYIDETKPLLNRDLLRVRSVEGIKWAVSIFKGLATVRAPSGTLKQVIILAVDDSSLIGQPPRMLLGNWKDLKEPNAIIMDRAGFESIWPGQKIETGRIVEINAQRAVIAGICDVSPPFSTFPVVFSRILEARRFFPSEHNLISFILAKAQTGISPNELARRIQQRTGLKAMTSKNFYWETIQYYLKNTAIPINFGITVLLGFAVGVGIAGQTFYIFVIESLKQFAVLKAIGFTSKQIFRMVLLQAITVAFIGFNIGLGLAAAFFSIFSNQIMLRDFVLRPQAVLGTFVAIAGIISLASTFSVRRVLEVNPSTVFGT